VDRSRFELRKFVAPEFIIGEKARLLAGRYAKNLGARHAMVVTGPHVEKAGWVEGVVKSLGEEGIGHTVFDGVSPNPRDSEVMNGAKIFAEDGCDSIVVVGGGSPIDCAKGIGIVFSNNRHILTFEGVDNIPIPPPPLICIPTTAGTGADVSQFAIISDTGRKVKIAIISKKIVPDIALVDPEPLLTLSKELTAHTGMDALTHSVEAYVSNASSPVTDMYALESIQIVNTYLPRAVEELKKLEWRYQTMLGSLFAGLAFSNASLGAVHAMAHSLGDSPIFRMASVMPSCSSMSWSSTTPPAPAGTRPSAGRSASRPRAWTMKRGEPGSWEPLPPCGRASVSRYGSPISG